MMGVVLVALVLMVVMILSACSKPPTQGVVEHKQHSSEVVYYTHPCLSWMRTPYKSGNTTYYTETCLLYGTNRNVIPASWELCIKGPDEDGKETTGCIEVGEQRWHQYQEGDYYDPAELKGSLR
jgi:hypothetical protein